MSICVDVCLHVQMPMENQWGCCISWNKSYRQCELPAMGTKTRTQVSCKSSWCSSPWVLCSVPPPTSCQGTWPLTTSRWENHLATVLFVSASIVGYMIRDRMINLWEEELSRMVSRSYSLGLSSGDHCLAGIARLLFKGEWEFWWQVKNTKGS